jgi:hypothetical protein
MKYLDDVLRIDGIVGFVIAEHPADDMVYCIKWEDNPDPYWTKPDWIIGTRIGSGRVREMLMEAEQIVRDAGDRELAGYDPLDYIH